MSRELNAFVSEFVIPMLGGGDVSVTRPLRPRDRDVWSMGLTGSQVPELSFWRLRRAQLLVADPELPDPDPDELSLWIGLHNLLVFDHPDRARVWTRASTWRRLEGATRTLLTLPMPTDPAELVVRHVSVGAFIELLRTDLVVPTPGGDTRLPVLDVGGRRRVRAIAGAGGPREETVAWLPQQHAAETERLLEDAMRASPLTCLLRPMLAPAGWSPLHCGKLLGRRGYARAVCHAWAAQRDWTRLGGAVMSALLPSLPGQTKTPIVPLDTGQLALPGAVVPCEPAELGALIGALVHLHLLKVLELDTRLGIALGSRDPGILAFLALPLLLPWLQDTLGAPLPTIAATAFETPILRRWTEYVDHLEELVPRASVENLLATLVPRIVQPS
jgi:hypothetical protein